MLKHILIEDTYLRLFTEDDTEEFFELTKNSRNYLKVWLGWLDNTMTVEDTVANIKERMKETAENKGYPLSFVIIYKDKIVGTIGFNTVDFINRVGGIGYWLGEAFQGKGIMTQAFEALLNYGFNDLKLNRIEVKAASGNIKSRSLPERFGFQNEGILRQNGYIIIMLTM